MRAMVTRRNAAFEKESSIFFLTRPSDAARRTWMIACTCIGTEMTWMAGTGPHGPVQRWLLQHKLGLTGLLPMLGEMGVLQPEDILDLSAADRARISASLRSLNLARWSRAVEGLAAAGQTGSVRTEGARTGTSEAAVGGPRLRSRPQALGAGPWDLGSRGGCGAYGLGAGVDAPGS